MANLEYKILPLFPEQVTDVERFSTQDVALFGDFKVNNRFKVGTHSIELHAYSQIGQLLKSDYSFKGYCEKWINLMDEVFEKKGSWEKRKNYQSWRLMEL